MGLNLSNAFKALNNVKRNLLSDYTTLKFIAIDKTLQTKPRYYLGTVTRNWFYEERRDPVTGAIVGEFIVFIPNTPQEKDWAKNCTQLEAVRADGSFTRFALTSPSPPHPPKYQWEYMVRPNAQDTDAI